MKTMPSVSYPDRWFILLSVPLWGFFLRHVGEPESLPVLVRNPQYFLDLAYAMALVLLLLLLNRYLVRRLDQQFSWAAQPLPRFFLQAVLAYGLSGLLVLMASFGYNDLLLQRPAPFNIANVFAADVPASLLIVTVVHLLYTGRWMVAYHQQRVGELRATLARLQEKSAAGAARSGPEITFPQTLVLRQGSGLVSVPAEQVAYVYLVQEVSVVRTLAGKSLSVDVPLEELLGQLSPGAFFRVNRQFIVHRPAIRRIEPDGGGRLLLHLHPAHPVEVAVSRRRAGDFRQWMGS